MSLTNFVRMVPRSPSYLKTAILFSLGFIMVFVFYSAVHKKSGASFQLQFGSGVSNASRCTDLYDWEDIKVFSKSQSKEDFTLWTHFFKHICHGKYLEAGALDGVKYSNTYVFSRALGWTGVLIEASPQNFERLKLNRNNDTLYHSAICDKYQKIHVVEKGAVGGIVEFMPDEFRRRWHPDLNIHSLPELECKPLHAIIGRNQYFDFFSLDVEGAEFTVLEHLDFNSLSFGVLLVEMNDPLETTSMKTLLNDKGYIHLFDENRSSWFVNKNFHNIYQNTLHPKT